MLKGNLFEAMGRQKNIEKTQLQTICNPTNLIDQETTDNATNRYRMTSLT
jgi:hypothetical protein